MDVANASVADYTSIGQYTCHGGTKLNKKADSEAAKDRAAALNQLISLG